MFDVFLYTIGFFWLAIIILSFVLIALTLIDDIKYRIKKKRKRRGKRNERF